MGFLVVLFLAISSICNASKECMFFLDPSMESTVIRDSAPSDFVKSAGHCSMICLLRDCLSHYYNNITGECVTHLSVYKSSDPSSSEQNWQYFVAYDQKTSWRVYDGHQYFFAEIVRGWVPAKTVCENFGANLVQIDSEDEEDWLISELSSFVWIGLNDKDVEAEFVWSTGNQPTYTNWGPTEPTNTGNEDCVVLRASTSGNWNDLSCLNSFRFVCELGPD